MKEVFKAAAEHKGTSVVEILLNCVIFADEVHKEITGKEVRKDNQIMLEHGKPMIFGKNRDKGLMMRCNKMEVVTLGENGVTEDDLIVHNAHDVDDTNHLPTGAHGASGFPVAMGVVRAIDNTVYEQELYKQLDAAKATTKVRTVDDLLRSEAFGAK
ncbi:MAG: hypothetical protein R2751_17840 [Bacteroidales bacterium]